MSKHLGFSCHKVGHRPMPNIPEETMILNGYPHVGRICKFCKCAYFELLSSEKMVPSGLVSTDGKQIIISEKN